MDSRGSWLLYNSWTWKIFLAPFCSAPVHVQTFILILDGLSSYLSPSEFEGSLADLGPKPINKYFTPHTQLQDAFSCAC